MSKDRKVYTYEPGGGFHEVDSSPVVNEEASDNHAEITNTSEPAGVVGSKQNENETKTVEEKLTSDETVVVDQNTQQEELVDNTVDSSIDVPVTQENEEVVRDDKNISEPNEQVESEVESEVESDESAPELEIPETDNFYKVAASRMIQTGELPEDFELPETLSDDEADNTIYHAYKDNLKPTAHKELLTEFQNEMKKKGWTQSTLEYASMLENGITKEEVGQLVDYKTLASVDTSKMDEDSMSDYVYRMYQDRNWKDAEIKRAINSAIDEGDLDKLSLEAVDYFKDRKDQYDTEVKQLAEHNMRQKEQIAQYKQSVISEVFNKKELGGEGFTEDQLDDFEEALYERKIPVQYNGQVYQISEFDQFDAALQNDFALKLWLFKKFKFRDSEVDQIKEQARREAEENAVMKWSKKTRKIEQEQQKEEKLGTATNNTTLRGSQTGGSTFVFEGGVVKEVPKI